MTPENHLRNLRRAGLDGDAFIQALIEIRDDTQISEDDRQRLYLIIAMESYIWHIEAASGAPVDRALFMTAVKEAKAQIAEEEAGESETTD